MKTIIDALKEIIKQDASTQTDPVTIIENEEDMAEIIPSKRVRTGESDDVTTRRRKTLDDTDVYSGKEHVQEEIEMKQQEQIMSDASFYDKCKAYLNNVDPEGYNYYPLLQAIESYIKNKVDLNQYIKGNIFVTNAECYETSEEISDALKKITAAVYIILADKAVPLIGYDNLKDGVSADLSYAIGIEMSGEIISFLEHYGE